MTAFLPFALPDIGDDDIAEVVDTLRSGWVTTGPKAARFEKAFAAYLSGSDDGHGLHTVAVNSATAGLHLAVEALGLGPGDEAIVPSHTFTSTAEVLRYVGADARIVDVLPGALTLDPKAAAAAVNPRTKAMLPVHYAGLAAPMRELQALAGAKGLAIIEDAAHALPTEVDGQRIGTLASAASVFSFYANKTITTGEGGMLVTRDEALAKRARVMRLHGMSRDAFDRFTTKTPAWYYEIVAPGFKYNLTDIAAALGLTQLAKADAFRARRAAIAARYRDAFADLPIDLPPDAEARGLHAWHLFVVRVGRDAPVDRDGLIEGLFQRGIGCSVHYVPLHRQPYWRDRYALRPEHFPVSEDAYVRGVSLPIYTRMDDAAVDRVISAVRDVLGRASPARAAVAA